jgi:cytochrome c biogenesis protein CcmG/thiol:disulfide interchange protein DsbE
MNRRWMWLAVLFAVALVAVVVFAYLPSGSGANGPAALVGKPGPSFAVVDMAGRPASLADYRGKIVVLNLWASWCPPCRAEMPDLERLYRDYAKRGVVVLGVDQGEAADRARTFATSLGITYPVLIDDAQQYGRVYAALGLPTTIVVDRTGVVAQAFDGALSYAQMRAAVEPLVAKT